MIDKYKQTNRHTGREKKARDNYKHRQEETKRRHTVMKKEIRETHKQWIRKKKQREREETHRQTDRD